MYRQTGHVFVTFVLVFSSFAYQPEWVFSQGSTRDANDTKQSSKFLTPGEVDHWVLEGKKDEVLFVNVSTSQFDPVLGLARSKGDQPSRGKDEILVSVDDEGNTSQFRYRLKQDGTYKIRVHGFEMKGGGHYNIGIRRIETQPVTFGKRISGNLDKEGRASFFFPGKLAENLTVNANGSSRQDLIDPEGKAIRYDWHTNLLVQKEGEHILTLRGVRNGRFDLVIRRATVGSLELGASDEAATETRSLHIWEIYAEPGQFRYVTVTRSQQLDSRLIYKPTRDENQKLQAPDNGFREIQMLPVSSKGDVTRFVLVFGRRGRYQLQSYSHQATDIAVAMFDPTTAIDRGQKMVEQIPIGGTRFFGFKAKAGELLEAKLDSDQFDCWLRLYDERGRLVKENDDTNATKNSRISHMVTRNGTYRWQVSSLGNGGGGKYELKFDGIPLKKLEIGENRRGKISSRRTEYWAFNGKKGQTVFINVRSASFDPTVSIFGPDGRRYDQDQSSGVGTDSLLAIRLPVTGRFTVWVSPRKGSGDYDIRVIDAGWKERKSGN